MQLVKLVNGGLVLIYAPAASKDDTSFKRCSKLT